MNRFDSDFYRALGIITEEPPVYWEVTATVKDPATQHEREIWIQLVTEADAQFVAATMRGTVEPVYEGDLEARHQCVSCDREKPAGFLYAQCDDCHDAEVDRAHEDLTDGWCSTCQSYPGEEPC